MLVALRIGLEDPLEIADEFRQAIFEKGFGPRLRLFDLIFVIKFRRDRVMRVVNLGEEIGDRQLQAMSEASQDLGFRREAELGPEIEELATCETIVSPSLRKGGAKGA